MAKIIIYIGLLIVGITNGFTQKSNLSTKEKKFKTDDKTIISGQVGYLTVPENRSNPESRDIKIKFIRLRSTSENPKEPVVYLEGGGSACTWQAENPEYLSDWINILKISDLIFIDQRGTTDRKLIYIQKNGYSENFLVSEEAANTYYEQFAVEALESFEEKGVDVHGYNIVEHAKDVDEITKALQIEKYSLFGFSFGTSIGMTLMRLYPEKIESSILVSADGPEQSFNYPSHLDHHFKKIAAMAKQDSAISSAITDLNKLFVEVMDKLKEEPAIVEVKHPLTGKSLDVKVGSFGLALLLRLDIDDYNDIPVIPRLLYSVDQGDYSILKYFIQKRLVFAFGFPGNGINQGIASGVSVGRWNQIEKEAKESLFGNVVNFPFSAALPSWPKNQISIDSWGPNSSQIRTLFITGDLDCRTPVQQVNELTKSFTNATHLIVRNAGHEQAMWDGEIWDEAIPSFLKGKDVSGIDAFYSTKIKFIPVTGNVTGHPSLER